MGFVLRRWSSSVCRHSPALRPTADARVPEPTVVALLEPSSKLAEFGPEYGADIALQKGNAEFRRLTTSANLASQDRLSFKCFALIAQGSVRSPGSR